MKLKPIEQVSLRFRYNIKRIEHLGELYKFVMQEKVFNPDYKADLLRSGVVLMHAALEDLIRQLIKAKSIDKPDILGDRLNFPNPADRSKPMERIKPDYLYKHAGKSVDDLIVECIDDYLNNQTYNNKKHINNALLVLKLDPDKFSEYSDTLELLAKRRHKIVHEGDRRQHQFDTHGRPRKLEHETFLEWLTCVQGFGSKALSALGAKETAG